MICPCSFDIHLECENPVVLEDNFYQCCCHGTTKAVVIEPSGEGYKEGDEMKDVLSTGRKRAAAKVLPTISESGTVCEWANLKYAGGGAVPIVGCKGNVIFPKKGANSVNVHHGPDKSVLNNDRETNLHAICATCHNRWHEINDPYYGIRPEAGQPFLPLEKVCLPHDKETKATINDLLGSEIWWETKKKSRPDYRSWENVTV